MDAVVEFVYRGQSVHNAAPDDGLYFPATQLVHARPFGPVNPALHVH